MADQPQQPDQNFFEAVLNQMAQQSTQMIAMQGALQNMLANPTPVHVEVAPSANNPNPINIAAQTAKTMERPPTFDGKSRSSCSTFVSQVRHYLRTNILLYPTDDSRINFVVGYLRDDAYRWIEPHLETRPIQYFLNFETFIVALLAAKGDPDIINTYTRKIEALKQTASASSYATEFFRLSAYLAWNDAALMVQFKRGLKPEIKDALALREIDPVSTQQLSDIAIRLDNRLFERREEKKHEGKPSNPQSNSNQSRSSSTVTRTSTAPSNNAQASKTTSTTTTSTGPAPMDLDAARSKKHKALTPQEREYRLKNNLCLYCGEGGHRAGQCPRKSAVRILAVLGAPATIDSPAPANNPK